MATFTESSVKVELEIKRLPDDSIRVIARGVSLDAAGTIVRRTMLDITDNLSAARQNGIADLMADVEGRLKTLWEIP